jgi:hypothetical protein
MPKKKPGVPKQPKAAKRIRFTLGEGHADFQGRANVQKSVRNTAPQSPKFTPAIKTALDNWSGSTDKAVALYEDIIAKEVALEQAYGNLGTAVAQVNTDRDDFVTEVEKVCTTAADAQTFGGNAVTRSKAIDAVAPATLRQILTDVHGTNRFRWPSIPGAGSYMAEVSTVDPPTATSWTSCYVGRAPFFVYAGTPGQKVSFRLCSVGRVPSPWSVIFTMTLR